MGKALMDALEHPNNTIPALACDLCVGMREHPRAGEGTLDPRPGFEEESPSFSVSPDGRIFNRFGDDGKGGNALTFLVSLGRSKGDAALELIRRAGLEAEDKTSRADTAKPNLNPRPQPSPSRARLKADRALERFHILSEEESAKLSSWLSPITVGSEAERELERRGLLPYLGTVYRASTLSRERKAGKRTLGVCGALVLEVASPTAVPWQGQTWALKIRNPGTKDELKVKGLERYTYLSSGHGSPSLCLSPSNESDAVLLIEGELSAVAAHVALEHLNKAFHIQGVAGASVHPYYPQLEGKRVYIYADGDAGGDGARQSWSTLALEYGAASVHVLAPLEGERDFCDVLGADGLDALAQCLTVALEGAKPFTLEPEQVSRSSEEEDALEYSARAGDYAESGGRTFWVKSVTTRESKHTVNVPLCNFTARIVSSVRSDDGAEVQSLYTLEGRLQDGTPLHAIDVPTAQFEALSWVGANWGASGAIVDAGQGKKDHLRAAIQKLSFANPAQVKRRDVYRHLGWRKLPNVGWAYLTSSGALTAQGLRSDIEVSVSPSLEHYALPDAPHGETLKEAVKVSLTFLEVAPDAVSIALYAALWRSILAPFHGTVSPTGPTGTAKSGLTALLLQHFAPGLTRYHFAQWSATDNALERLLFEAKDAPVCIDDFNPTGGQQDVKKWHAKAERVLRAQGNGQGRSRMRADGTMRADLPPRGLCISTGEETPGGHSLKARVLLLEVKRGDVDLEKLKALESMGRRGILGEATAGFLRFLAPQLEEQRKVLEKLEGEAQKHFPASHGRTTDMAAALYAGFEGFLSFALTVGAVTEMDSSALLERARVALSGTAGEQAQYHASSDPVSRFPALLVALLEGGRGFLADSKTEGQPDNPTSYGWQVTGQDPLTLEPYFRAVGQRIGWVSSEGKVYLEWESTFAALQKLSAEQGEHIPVSGDTLLKRLAEGNHIVQERYTSGGKPRVDNRPKRTIAQRRIRVAELTPSSVGFVRAMRAGALDTDSDEEKPRPHYSDARINNAGSEKPGENETEKMLEEVI